MVTPLKIARTAADLSQEGLAELAGLDPSTIWRLERGVYYPGRHARRALTTALGISEERLFPKTLAGQEPADTTAE